MSKIFLEHFFSEIFVDHDHNKISNYCQYNLTNWIETLPDDCDAIGISFYTNFYASYLPIIDKLLPKTKKLLLNISEPTDPYILKFINIISNKKIKIFTDIVTNDENSDNFKTKISWFVDSRNYYAQYQWAKDLTTKIELPRSWQPRSYMFDCLLGSRKNHRDIVHNLYLKSIYKNKVYFTYYKDDPAQGSWGDYYDKKNTFNNLYRFVPDINYGGVVGMSLYAIIPYYIYNDSYYSIVAETTAFNSYNQYTEKVIKPILARRPFVAFCGQYYLRNLRSLGFKTFGDVIDIDGKTVIDESYDDEPNDRVRWQMAWNQVEQLCSKDPTLVYAQLQNILDYNLHHFLETNWHQEILNELLMPFD
jgi:hypothetical protein